MLLRSNIPANAALLSSTLFPALIIAVGDLDCKQIVTGDKIWDFSKIGGPRSAMESLWTDPTWENTTYTIDICTNLKRPSSVPKDEQCKEGTRVCAIKHSIKPSEGAKKPQDMILTVTSIAGDLKDVDGSHLDAKYTRLRDSDLDADAGKEGLRIELNGGINPQRKQKAVVEFLCDPDRIGTETNFIPEDKYENEDKDITPTEGDPSLEFVSYGNEGTDIDILRLKWRTKYACEDRKDENDGSKGSHWGFFTWFLIVAFLITAAYLIFGSWLNYNRYGARGWDLIPHGDTIRDVPYLLKDWTRRVVNTVQGSGSRGGYSAV